MNKPEYTQDNIDRLTEEVTQHFDDYLELEDE
jgi:hypothetical protein